MLPWVRITPFGGSGSAGSEDDLGDVFDGRVTVEGRAASFEGEIPYADAARRNVVGNRECRHDETGVCRLRDASDKVGRRHRVDRHEDQAGHHDPEVCRHELGRVGRPHDDRSPGFKAQIATQVASNPGG
jgi:hypothetical protein